MQSDLPQSVSMLETTVRGQAAASLKGNVKSERASRAEAEKVTKLQALTATVGQGIGLFCFVQVGLQVRMLCTHSWFHIGPYYFIERER